MRVPTRIRMRTALGLTVLGTFGLGVFGIAGSGVHVVKRGETLAEIAAANGTTVKALVSENGLRDANLIVIGQELKIPAAPGTPPAAATTYVVEDGDTLAAIAAKFGTTVTDLAAANGITNVNRIRAGQSLAVTPAAPAPAATPPAATGAPVQLPGQRHVVQAGETINSIASRYGVRPIDLATWNGIVDGQLYRTASIVLYDPGPLPGAGSPQATSHTVANGDTLGAIAARYRVAVAALTQANNIANPNRIRIGQVLTVPAATTGARCPVPGSTYVNDWGFPRSGGRAHAGNDLFAPRGTPVLAPVAGTVATATGAIGGHQFRLTAPDGTLWFGSHLDRFGASGAVNAGDVIGYVGDSGNARGSRTHLHFEIHAPNGNPVNPYPLLRTVC